MAATTPILPTATSLSASWSPAAPLRQARRAPSWRRRGSRRKTHFSPGSARYGAGSMGRPAARRKRRFRPLPLEHHGLAVVQEHPVVEHVGDGAGEHAALDVAPLANQVLRRVAVADALHILFDDR